MRRFTIVLGLLLLSACGGSGGSTEVACKAQYWDGTLGTCLPEGWNALSPQEVQARGMPAEVLLAFQAEAAVSGQYPTISVTTEPLANDLSPTEYSQASRSRVARRRDYTEIDVSEITIDNQKVHLHVFSAQPIGEEPRQRFYQVATAVGKKGYVFTGALPLTAPDAAVEQMTLILQNVSFVEPVAEEE